MAKTEGKGKVGSRWPKRSVCTTTAMRCGRGREAVGPSGLKVSDPTRRAKGGRSLPSAGGSRKGWWCGAVSGVCDAKRGRSSTRLMQAAGRGAPRRRRRHEGGRRQTAGHTATAAGDTGTRMRSQANSQGANQRGGAAGGTLTPSSRGGVCGACPPTPCGFTVAGRVYGAAPDAIYRSICVRESSP